MGMRNKGKKTRKELDAHVERLILKADELCYDVAMTAGQNFDNVKHMKWFREKMADQLIEDLPEKYGHLKLRGGLESTAPVLS